jgi:hypothetical protein
MLERSIYTLTTQSKPQKSILKLQNPFSRKAGYALYGFALIHVDLRGFLLGCQTGPLCGRRIAGTFPGILAMALAM